MELSKEHSFLRHLFAVIKSSTLGLFTLQLSSSTSYDKSGLQLVHNHPSWPTRLLKIFSSSSHSTFLFRPLTALTFIELRDLQYSF